MIATSSQKKKKNLLKKMNIAINDQKERILADLQEKFSQKKSKDNAIITLGIEKEGRLCYLRDLRFSRRFCFEWARTSILSRSLKVNLEEKRLLVQFAKG